MVGLEDLILDQVTNDVERHSQVLCDNIAAFGELGAVIQEEVLGRITANPGLHRSITDRRHPNRY